MEPAPTRELAALPADLEALARLLSANGLPSEDLAEPGREFFEFHLADGAPVGVGGLEIHGADALLRSVVTLEAARGRDHGRAIVEWLAEHAAQAGVRTLYLLTFSAPDFFAACGFETIARDAAPQAIAATEEFSRLCPESAVCLKRDLKASAPAVFVGAGRRPSILLAPAYQPASVPTPALRRAVVTAAKRFGTIFKSL